MGVFDFLKPKITVTTHSGTFHADDVFSVAVLKIWAEKNNLNLKIKRSRDPEVINKSDIVVDVGMKYEAENHRFDHHQKSGAGLRENGIPYASFGLVWKYYGEKICSAEIAKRVDKTLVTPVDARDNGVAISLMNDWGVIDHRTSNMISAFNPTWQERKDDTDSQFKKAVDFAIEILKREIVFADAIIEGSKLTRQAIESQNYPEILVLDQQNLLYEEEVTKHKNIKFVVSPSSDGWSLDVAKENLEDYDSDRATLPEAWHSLRDQELQNISGIKDAIFCIRGGWFAKAKTKEAAIEMAKKALK